MIWDNWGWPQWVIAGLMIFNIIAAFIRHKSVDNSISSVLGTIVVTLIIAWGGFWR